MLLTVNWVIFIYIVNNVNIKTASFAYLVCPVITAVLGYVLIKERLSIQQWLAVGLCAISCALMGLSSWTELLFSFFTALSYALYLISQRKNQGFDRIIVLGVQVLFSFVLLSALYNFLVDQVPSSEEFYMIIIIIAGVFTVFPLFLNLFALNRINSATIGILMYLNPVINFTVAFIVFDEGVTSLQILGYIIIIAALILFNYQNIRKLQTSMYSQKA
jgi:chloramphenicol-sensitive protein RarD